MHILTLPFSPGPLLTFFGAQLRQLLLLMYATGNWLLGLYNACIAPTARLYGLNIDLQLTANAGLCIGLGMGDVRTTFPMLSLHTDYVMRFSIRLLGSLARS